MELINKARVLSANRSVGNKIVGKYPEEVALRPALGNYASGDRFWDREQEVRDIVNYLVDGASVLVNGPRRIGKTSVVRRVLAQLAPSRTTLFIDVEKCAGPTEMFATLAADASRDAAAWAQIQRWFGKRISRIKSVEIKDLKVELHAAMVGSWRDDGRAIIEALARGDRATVIAVDELPLLADRMLREDPAGTELFLGLLRALSEETRGVRWLISGSIGLEAVLHRAGLTGFITWLRTYPIGAWDEATTMGAAAALARTTGLALADGAALALHDHLGLGVPFHVQLFMDELRRDADRRDARTVTAADVARVYDGPFLTSAVRTHMQHLEARLGRVLDGDALRLARDMLTKAAVANLLTGADAMVLANSVVEDASQRTSTLREVFEILEHDAYLGRDANGWRYQSKVVRDWWKQGNELGFIPASERQ